MSCDVGEATENLENELYSWRMSSVSPMSQIILQPFFLFYYVTGFSLTSPGEPPNYIKACRWASLSGKGYNHSTLFWEWIVEIRQYLFLEMSNPLQPPSTLFLQPPCSLTSMTNAKTSTACSKIIFSTTGAKCRFLGYENLERNVTFSPAVLLSLKETNITVHNNETCF